MELSPYQRAVSAIEARGIMPERAPSLEPMKCALRASGLLERIDPARVVIVAGTNGKGSVSAMLSSLICSTGARVGLYTSPHLVETTERIRINGEEISAQEFVRAFRAIEPLMISEGLSHFETLTLMAAWVFFSGELAPPVDQAVFEVGLGGTWDATNAIPHRRCVITSLAMDHENLLGNNLSEIAANKFGVVGTLGVGDQVVHAPLPPEVQALARQTAHTTQSTWTPARRMSFEVEPSSGRGEDPRFWLQTPWGKARLALPGARGALNAATALTAFETFGWNPAPHLAALAHVKWPGRMERAFFKNASAPCPVYLSGDHNPQGVQSLLELLPHYPRKHLHLLVGVGKDKDCEGILSPLSQLPDASLYLTETPFRGRPLSDYGSWLKIARFAEAGPCAALQKIFQIAQSDDLILVTGSLYLVGEIQRCR